MNMRKIVLFMFILTTEKICAQSSYMYEVAEDAGYVNDGGFLNIIGLIIMLDPLAELIQCIFNFSNGPVI